MQHLSIRELQLQREPGIMSLAAGAADLLSGVGLLPHCSDVMLMDMCSYRPPDELRMVMKEVKNVGRTWKVCIAAHSM